MVVQLPLPAAWAQLESQRESDQLANLRADVRDAKAKIRTVLDELAERHGIPAREVAYSMGYVDDLLSDVIYDLECELEHGIERDNPV
jgi:hypothetical protein